MRRISVEDKRQLKNLQARLRRKARQLDEIGVNYILPTIGMKDLRSKSRKDYNKLVKFIENELKNEDLKTVRNKHGVIFTKQQERVLEQELKKRNEVMRKQWEIIRQFDVTAGGQKITVQDIAENVRYGKYNRFNQRIKSINDFRSMREYAEYLDFIKEEGNPNLLQQEMVKYKDILLKSIDTAFGVEGTDVHNRIFKMSSDDLLKLYYTTDYLNPDFIYEDKIDYDRRLHDLRRALKLS